MMARELLPPLSSHCTRSQPTQHRDEIRELCHHRSLGDCTLAA
ncbi:MAG: hypothetical protein ACI8PZ_005255, partial [Myxococcota bacterium]